MEVRFKNTTGVGFKNLKFGVGNSDFRPAMQGAYVDFKESKLIVTNAHVLAVFPIEITKKEDLSEMEGKIVNINLFNNLRYMTLLSKKDIEFVEFVLTDDYAEAHYFGELIFRSKYIDAKYPNWQAVMPKDEDRTSLQEIAVGIPVLKQISNLLPFSSVNSGYKWTFHGTKKPILLESFNRNEGVKISAIIMPVSID